MKKISKNEFESSLDEIIDNAILYEEIVIVESEAGNVVLMTEHQMNCMLESMAKKRII